MPRGRRNNVWAKLYIILNVVRRQNNVRATFKAFFNRFLNVRRRNIDAFRRRPTDEIVFGPRSSPPGVEVIPTGGGPKPHFQCKNEHFWIFSKVMYLVNLGALSTVAAFFCPGTLYLARKSFLHASQYFFFVSRGGTSGWLIWVDFFIHRRGAPENPPCASFWKWKYAATKFCQDFLPRSSDAENVVEVPH